MKNVWLLTCLIASLLFGCCDGENCDDDTNVMDAQELVTELARLNLIVDVENGEFGVELKVHGRDGSEIALQLAADFGFYAEPQETSSAIYMDGIYLQQKHLAVVTCDPFGWGPEYDWLCTMNGTKGRAIAKDVVEPTIADVGTYIEAGSEMYPIDPGITSITFFNADTYALYLDTNANPAAFFGLTIANFGPEWNPLLEQWCTNDHIPMCIQE